MVVMVVAAGYSEGAKGRRGGAARMATKFDIIDCHISPGMYSYRSITLPPGGMTRLLNLARVYVPLIRCIAGVS